MHRDPSRGCHCVGSWAKLQRPPHRWPWPSLWNPMNMQFQQGQFIFQFLYRPWRPYKSVIFWKSEQGHWQLYHGGPYLGRLDWHITRGLQLVFLPIDWRCLMSGSYPWNRDGNPLKSGFKPDWLGTDAALHSGIYSCLSHPKWGDYETCLHKCNARQHPKMATCKLAWGSHCLSIWWHHSFCDVTQNRRWRMRPSNLGHTPPDAGRIFDVHIKINILLNKLINKWYHKEHALLSRTT